MTTTHKPITVLKPGVIIFNEAGGMTFRGWFFDGGDRALGADADKVHAAELVQAVGDYVASRVHAQVSAAHATSDLLNRVSRPPLQIDVAGNIQLRQFGEGTLARDRRATRWPAWLTFWRRR
jgi:hypothetical protein